MRSNSEKSRGPYGLSDFLSQISEYAHPGVSLSAMPYATSSAPSMLTMPAPNAPAPRPQNMSLADLMNGVFSENVSPFDYSAGGGYNVNSPALGGRNFQEQTKPGSGASSSDSGDWNPVAGAGNSVLNGLASILASSSSAGSADNSALDDALAQLNDLISSSGQAVDTDAMIADIANGIKQAYGSQISSVRHQMQGARRDTRSGTKQTMNLYKQLANMNAKAGRREAKQGKHLADQLQAAGQTAAANANANVQDELNMNAAAAANLGDTGLGQQLNQNLTASAQDAGNRAIEAAGRQATAQLATSGVNRRWFNDTAAGAQLEGTNRSADLINQLQDYLQGSRDKIGEIAGQRAQALAGVKNDILMQAAQMNQQSQQDQIANYFKELGMRMDWAQAQAANQLNQQKLQAQLAGGGSSSDLYGKIGKIAQIGQGNPQALDYWKQLMMLPDASKGTFQVQNNNTTSEVPLNSTAGQMQWLMSQPWAKDMDEKTFTAIMAILGNSTFNVQQSPY